MKFKIPEAITTNTEVIGTETIENKRKQRDKLIGMKKGDSKSNPKLLIRIHNETM